MGVVALAAYWTAIFIGTHLPAVLDITPGVNDKVKHFSAFFFLGTLLCYVTNSQRWFRRFMTIGLAGMAYAAVDELTQALVPGRYPDSFDFLADSAGIWSAIGIYMIARYRFKNLVDARLVAKT
jgi:VanZ family protein